MLMQSRRPMHVAAAQALPACSLFYSALCNLPCSQGAWRSRIVHATTMTMDHACAAKMQPVLLSSVFCSVAFDYPDRTWWVGLALWITGLSPPPPPRTLSWRWQEPHRMLRTCPQNHRRVGLPAPTMRRSHRPVCLMLAAGLPAWAHFHLAQSMRKAGQQDRARMPFILCRRQGGCLLCVACMRIIWMMCALQSQHALQGSCHCMIKQLKVVLHCMVMRCKATCCHWTLSGCTARPCSSVTSTHPCALQLDCSMAICRFSA